MVRPGRSNGSRPVGVAKVANLDKQNDKYDQAADQLSKIYSNDGLLKMKKQISHDSEAYEEDPDSGQEESKSPYRGDDQMDTSGFEKQLNQRMLNPKTHTRTSMSTGKKKPQKATMLNEVEEWYQYTPTFSKHIKRGKKVPGTVKKPTSNIIKLLKSPFPKRPPSLFFDYPAYVGESKFTGNNEDQRIDVKSQEDMKNMPVLFKIHENANIYNSLVNSCKNAGVILVDTGYDWNFLWSGYTSGDVLSDVDKYQRINHFPGSYQIG